MDQNAEIETESDVLKRIVALLFSLAGLAERASVRSYPVRCLVLWLLRPAEAVVRDWLLEDGWEEPQTAESGVLHRNSRAEAMHLARSLRTLAHLLKRELRLEARLVRRLTHGQSNRSTGEVHRRLLAADLLRRLAQAIRVATRRLGRLRLHAAPRLDTS